jgi:hypothetical protein
MHFKPVDGPTSFVEQLKGEWVLDSVQVKEIMSGEVVQMTVQPHGGLAKFSHIWMYRFKLTGEGKASYSENAQRKITRQTYYVSDIPYIVEDIDENTASLIIDGVPEYKILKMQLLTDNTMLIRQSFTADYNSQDIEVSWSLFYHKSDQIDPE